MEDPQLQQQQQQPQQQAAEDDVQPVAVLIDELRSSDLQVRLNSFGKLTVVAQALKPQRVRDELVPYLVEFIDDEDDILLVLVEQLGELAAYMGGAQYVFGLLQPLEPLAGVEEGVVRDNAVEVVKKLMDTMPPAHVTQHVMPLITRLGRGDWFTSRISATKLFVAIYSRVAAQQQAELRELFVQLCQDETPMVRRAACQQLGLFVDACDPRSVHSQLYGAYVKLTQDDQDSVRLLTVKATVHVAKLYKAQGNVSTVLPAMLQLCKDKSWRVRYMAADQFCELCNAIGEEETRKDQVVQTFVALLEDNEAEVRTAAVLKLGEVAKLIGGQQTMTRLITPVKALASDQCQYTKAALGSTVMSVASVLPAQQVYEQLLPMFLQLLRDPSAEVRLNIISKLATVNEVIGVKKLSSSLLPAICELAQDVKWRVRLAIIGHIPLLAKQLGHEFFEAKLLGLCMNCLGDQVYSIREAATANLTKLTDVFGARWAQVHIVPKILQLGRHKSYLYRMTALNAIKDLARALGARIMSQKLLLLVLDLASDSVPNVRFNVARTLGEILPHLEPAIVRSKVVACLQGLYRNADPDVKEHAERALAKIDEMSMMQ